MLAAPVAVNDAFGGLEDTPLTISAPGVIANDTDLDGDPLLVVLAGQAGRGSVSLNANGGFHYTPNANLFGLDSFTYTLRDATGLSGNTATVTISVAGVNDPPVAVNDSYLTLEDTPLTIFAPGVLANDTDVEGYLLLTAEIVSFPAYGTLTLLPNGGFQYVPTDTGPCAAPFIGPDSFTYRARDQELASNLATVTISITPLGEPPAPFGIPIATQEDFPVTREAPGLLSITVPPGPCAPPGTPPAVFSYFGPATLISPPRNGMMTVQPDGRFTYVPNANFNGNDDFMFRAFDAQQQPVQVFATMVVAPVNDAPQATPDMYQVREDERLEVPAAGILANDFDVDGNTLSADRRSTGARNAVDRRSSAPSLADTVQRRFHLLSLCQLQWHRQLFLPGERRVDRQQFRGCGHDQCHASE